MSCDGTAKEISKEAVNNGKLPLSGDASDPDWKGLINSTIKVIAKEHPIDVIRNEVDALSEICACELQEDKSPSFYSNPFKVFVAGYVNLISSLNSVTSR